MKTFADLLKLIQVEIEMNEGKLVEYQFMIDTKYKWVSMYEIVGGVYEKDKVKESTIFNSMSYKKDHELQMVYWTIYNKGRSKFN